MDTPQWMNVWCGGCSRRLPYNDQSGVKFLTYVGDKLCHWRRHMLVELMFIVTVHVTPSVAVATSDVDPH